MAAPAARRKSSPFLRPAHPCCWTVRTSWSTRWLASRRGNCSSSRTRTNRQRFVDGFKYSYDLLTRNCWEGIEEFVDAVPTFQVVDQVAKRDACASENWCPAEDVRIRVNDFALV